MLIADFWTSLGSALWTKFYQICFVIDGTLSKLIYGVFSVFMSLAETRIFSSDIVSDLTNRSYIVISIIMLFVLAYSILRMMINPDDITKGKFSGFALVKRIVIAIFVIAFTPAIFDFSYGLQHSVLKNNVVGKVITGSNSDSITDSAGEFTVSIFTANCYLSNHYSDEAKEEYEAAKEVALASGDVTEFQSLIPYIVNQQVVYHNFISLIVNGIILYVLVTFCFDMAIRVVKLAFLQLITPIPAIMYILPGQEASLSKWIKESAKCFFEVVVRLAVMYFTVFLFLIINRKIDSGTLFESMGVPTQNGFRMFSVVVYSMTKYFVIFGLLAFMKQAPKLISDLFGIKADKGTFNLKQKVKDSIGTIYNPARKVVDKTAGAAGGLAAGMVMYGKGKKAGVSGSPGKAALAAFNGVRNGFRGGIRKGISGAYDYEYIMQSAYAQQADEKYDLRTGIMDSMRDNFGFLSRYDSIKRDKQLERDVYNSTRYENVRSVDNEFAPDIENINAQHKITVDATTTANETYGKFKAEVDKETKKSDSTFKVNNGEMIENWYVTSQHDYISDKQKYEESNKETQALANDLGAELNNAKSIFDSVNKSADPHDSYTKLSAHDQELYKKYTEYDKKYEENRKNLSAYRKSEAAFASTKQSIDIISDTFGLNAQEKADLIKSCEIQSYIQENEDFKGKTYNELSDIQKKQVAAQFGYDPNNTDDLKKMHDLLTVKNGRLNESFNRNAIEAEMQNILDGKTLDAAGNAITDQAVKNALNDMYSFGDGKIVAEYCAKGINDPYSFSSAARTYFQELERLSDDRHIGSIRIKNNITGEYEETNEYNMKSKLADTTGVGLAKMGKKLSEVLDMETENINKEKSNIVKKVNVYTTDSHGNRVLTSIDMNAYEAEKFKAREKEEAEAKNKETERILESMENLVKAQQTMKEARSKADSIKNGK